MGKEWFKLSKTIIIVLFVYYIVVFLIGIIGCICALLNETSFLKRYTTLEKSIFAAMSMALLGSSFFYIKKLYKACINQDVSPPTTAPDEIRQIGVASYFFLRPAFAIGLCLLLLVGMRASILGATKTNTELDDGFIYLMMFMSFFAGFSSGDFLDILQDFGKGFITSIFVNKPE